METLATTSDGSLRLVALCLQKDIMEVSVSCVFVCVVGLGGYSERMVIAAVK